MAFSVPNEYAPPQGRASVKYIHLAAPEPGANAASAAQPGAAPVGPRQSGDPMLYYLTVRDLPEPRTLPNRASVRANRSKGAAMASDEGGIEPGFYSESLDPGEAERLVLRFPAGDILVLPHGSGPDGTPHPDGQVRLELELRGPGPRLQAWRPSVRRREGILVIADEEADGIRVVEARVRVPAALRDLEAHSSTGGIEIRELGADVLAGTESGSVRISGGAAIEASTGSGDVEVEGAASLTVRVASGSIRCRDIAGYVSAEAHTGDVNVESAGGNVVIIGGSGDVSVQKPGGRLRIATQSGDVELEIDGRFAGGEVSTNSGDVSLSLAGADLELRAETLSGELDAAGAEINATTGPRRCALRLGGGGRRLHVRSVSGDVEIQS
jgi:hypothetical protein